MFINRNTPTYVFLINLMICLVICAVIYLCRNPLAILGIFLLQEMPIFQGNLTDLRGLGYADNEDDDDDDDDEHDLPSPTAPGDDYAGTKAGFTGKLRLRSAK